MGLVRECVDDLGAAAYIMMHHYQVLGKRGRSVCFEINADEISEIQKLYKDYLNSDFHRFDSCLMSLKKMKEFISESKEEDVVQKNIDDLGVAAYIMMHNYKVLGKRGKSVCFEIKEVDLSKVEKLYKDYLNSEFHRFDSCLMSLKKMREFSEDE